jgi:Protein of unknown function (DUF3500)
MSYEIYNARLFAGNELHGCAGSKPFERERDSSAFENAYLNSRPRHSYEDTISLRRSWTFEVGAISRTREGLALKEMSANQRELVDEILKSVLSENGFIRAKAIMSDQQVLARNEEGLGAGYYWFAIYGEPGNSGPWAWRIGGHHLSLHFTYVDNSLIGLPVSEFDQNQKTMFLKLIEDYTGVFGSEIAKTRLEKIRQTALTNVYFGWAGSRHSTDAEDYYRIQGPDFLIEYSNTGKHLHSVWRELNDFGIRSRPPN